MAAPTIYKSTDDNAPVLIGTIGSLVNVLNKCLVTGYGEKSPAGWTMPFGNIGETKACFRNNQATGTDFYLIVDHSIYVDRMGSIFRNPDPITGLGVLCGTVDYLTGEAPDYVTQVQGEVA